MRSLGKTLLAFALLHFVLQGQICLLLKVSLNFQGKPFSITVIQVYAPTSNTEEAEVEWFYEDLQDLLELTPQKDVLSLSETGMQM